MIFRPWLLVLLICGFGAGEASAQTAHPAVAGTSAGSDQLPPWRVPDITSLPNDEHGLLVRYGRELIDHTSALIGPDASNPAQRYTGNGLECSSCHVDAGTSRYAIPLVGIANLYPAFSARLDAPQDLAGRVNDCMQRSMNGRPLPLDSREMQGLLGYLTFLGSQQAAGQAPVGRGAPKLPLPTRAADPGHGATVYQGFCAACHQANGLGVKFQTGDRLTEQRRYLYPPLWGSDSYNDAAGMARIVTAAWFVHANMPKGVTWQYPLVAPDDAYDVMAFVNTQPRPHKPDLAKDYPDLWLKPIGAQYPPWVGHFGTAQNRFGPWQPILDWRRDNSPATGSEGVTAANDIEQSLHAVSRAP